MQILGANKVYYGECGNGEYSTADVDVLITPDLIWSGFLIKYFFSTCSLNQSSDIIGSVTYSSTHIS